MEGRIKGSEGRKERNLSVNEDFLHRREFLPNFLVVRVDLVRGQEVLLGGLPPRLPRVGNAPAVEGL
jgi:hypothetical protein